MSSPIRELLADAQAAEVRGDKARAARILRRLAALYRDANNQARALKMLRHARRLEGLDEDDESGDAPTAPEPRPGPAEEPEPEAGDEDGREAAQKLEHAHEGERAHEGQYPHEGQVPHEGEQHHEGDHPHEGERRQRAARRRPRRELEERTATLAPRGLEAWCSFCCRPRREVGALVAGPAGAFICHACVGLAGGLLTGAPAAVARPGALPSPPPPARAGFVETTRVRRARQRLESRTGKLTLLVGPEGSGKSALLAAMGEALRLDAGSVPASLEPMEQSGPGEVLLIDLAGPIGSPVEDRLLDLVARGARLAIAVRAEPPRPALVLTGAEGEEPLYDTAGLAAALGSVVAHGILSNVDGVVVLGALDEGELEELAVGLVATRADLSLDAATVQRLAALARQSGRGAHELVALLARVPRGTWKGQG